MTFAQGGPLPITTAPPPTAPPTPGMPPPQQGPGHGLTTTALAAANTLAATTPIQPAVIANLEVGTRRTCPICNTPDILVQKGGVLRKHRCGPAAASSSASPAFKFVQEHDCTDRCPGGKDCNAGTCQHWHPCSCKRGQPCHNGKVWGPPWAFPPPKNDKRSKTCLEGKAHNAKPESKASRDASNKKAAEKVKAQQAQMAAALAALNTDE